MWLIFKLIRINNLLMMAMSVRQNPVVVDYNYKLN